MVLRFTALLLMATSLFMLQHAAKPIVEQNRKVQAWPAVEVTVVGRFTDERPYLSARPKPPGLSAPQLQIVYRHEVAGQVFRLSRFNPRTEELAPLGPALLEKGEASYTRRGHFNPAKPSELFLPESFGVGSYWLVFFWGPVLGLGFGALVLRKPGYSLDAGGAARRVEKGWHRLPQKYSIRHRARGAWGVAVVTCAVTGLAAYDYFTGEPRRHTLLSNAVVILCLAPAAVTLGLAMYYAWLARRVGDARVMADAAHATPGSRLAVKVELPAKADIDLEQVTVSLACVRSEFTGPRFRFRERVIWEHVVERSLTPRRRLEPGHRVTFEERFTLPAEADHTFRGGFFGPWIDWEVRLHFRLDNGPDYRGKFPITVDA